MHAVLSRGGTGLKVGLCALGVAALALALGRPVGAGPVRPVRAATAALEASPASDAQESQAPVLEAVWPEDDPNRDLTPTLYEPSNADEPFPLPEVIDEEMLGDGTRADECFDVGDYLVTFSASNRLRADIVEFTSPRTLREFSMRLNVTSATQTLHFYIYERNTQTGQYTLVNPAPILRTAAQAGIGGSTGLRYYSSGLIGGTGIPVVPGAGKYYLIGVAWTSPAITFGLDNVTYPVNTPFGRTQGSMGFNAAPPYLSTVTVTLVRNGAYAIKMCLNPPTGACCMGTGCVQRDRLTCITEGGEYTEDALACTNGLCPLAEGACCIQEPFNRRCELTDVYDCENRGEWLGMVSTNGDSDSDDDIDLDDWQRFHDCLISTNGYSAACLSDFDFVPFDNDVDLRDFAAFQAAFGGTPSLISHCADNPCAFPRGRCCHLDGYCEDDVTELYCRQCPDSLWTENAVCDLNGCGPLGACCRATGPCQLTVLGDCTGVDSWCFGLSCSEVNECADGCLVVGACCSATTCDDGLTIEECETTGRQYLGDATHCCDTACPDPEPCCNTNGTCTSDLPDLCLADGGAPQGIGTTCATVSCTAAEACCFNGGGCQELTPALCAAQGGSSYGPGSDCSPNPCLQGCCLPSGGCLQMTPSNCAGAGGLLRGPGSNCGAPCDGACCLPNNFCIDATEDECVKEAGGTWHAATTCAMYGPCP